MGIDTYFYKAVYLDEKGRFRTKFCHDLEKLDRFVEECKDNGIVDIDCYHKRNAMWEIIKCQRTLN
jgi:hypothetical protein